MDAFIPDAVHDGLPEETDRRVAILERLEGGGGGGNPHDLMSNLPLRCPRLSKFEQPAILKVDPVERGKQFNAAALVQVSGSGPGRIPAVA